MVGNATQQIRRLRVDSNRPAGGAEAIRVDAACERPAWESLGEAVETLTGRVEARA